MSKFVMLNKDAVVIDIVDVVKPVRKAANGNTILCDPEICEGYIGSDNNTVYAKMGMQFQPSFYDIAQMYMVDDVPALVTPLTHKYDPEEGFTLNEDVYPDTNLGLIEKERDLEDMVLEMSEIIYA